MATETIVAPIPRPPIDKTPTMIRVEAAYSDLPLTDIRDIILWEISGSLHDRHAVANISNRIGHPLDPSILSTWVRRLGILGEAQAAKRARPR